MWSWNDAVWKLVTNVAMLGETPEACMNKKGYKMGLTLAYPLPLEHVHFCIPQQSLENHPTPLPFSIQGTK